MNRLSADPQPISDEHQGSAALLRTRLDQASEVNFDRPAIHASKLFDMSH